MNNNAWNKINELITTISTYGYNTQPLDEACGAKEEDALQKAIDIHFCYDTQDIAEYLDEIQQILQYGGLYSEVA